MASEIARPSPPENDSQDRARAIRDEAFGAKRAWHRREAAKSPIEKIATLLALQREVLPILRVRRPLAPHERPWPIRP